jgi:hypothetical protein
LASRVPTASPRFFRSRVARTLRSALRQILTVGAPKGRPGCSGGELRPRRCGPLKKTSYRCRAVGDGLTILSTSTIEEARQVLEEDSLIKRGLRTSELRKWELREGRIDFCLRTSVSRYSLGWQILARTSVRAQQTQPVPITARCSRQPKSIGYSDVHSCIEKGLTVWDSSNVTQGGPTTFRDPSQRSQVAGRRP